MKDQISRISITLIIAALMLLGAGCAGSKTSENATSSTNAEMAKAADDPGSKSCEADLLKAIDNLPKDVRENFTREFIAAEKYLIITGFVEGKGNLYKLLRVLEKYQTKECLIRISFLGKGGTDFEWRLPANSPTELCGKATVDGEVLKGDIKKQIETERNLKYEYDAKADKKEIDFAGFIYGPDNFANLMQRIEPLEKKGCVQKIVFAKTQPDPKMLIVRSGFEWQGCDGNMCPCDGFCVPCPCDRKDDKNTNTNNSDRP